MPLSAISRLELADDLWFSVILSPTHHLINPTLGTTSFISLANKALYLAILPPVPILFLHWESHALGFFSVMKQRWADPWGHDP